MSSEQNEAAPIGNPVNESYLSSIYSGMLKVQNPKTLQRRLFYAALSMDRREEALRALGLYFGSSSSKNAWYQTIPAGVQKDSDGETQFDCLTLWSSAIWLLLQTGQVQLALSYAEKMVEFSSNKNNGLFTGMAQYYLGICYIRLAKETADYEHYFNLLEQSLGLLGRALTLTSGRLKEKVLYSQSVVKLMLGDSSAVVTNSSSGGKESWLLKAWVFLLPSASTSADSLSIILDGIAAVKSSFMSDSEKDLYLQLHLLQSVVSGQTDELLKALLELYYSDLVGSTNFSSTIDLIVDHYKKVETPAVTTLSQDSSIPLSGSLYEWKKKKATLQVLVILAQDFRLKADLNEAKNLLEKCKQIQDSVVQIEFEYGLLYLHEYFSLTNSSLEEFLLLSSSNNQFDMQHELLQSASKTFNKCLLIDPYHFYSKIMTALFLYHSQQQYELCRSLLENAMKTSMTDKWYGWFLLGRVYEVLGDFERAGVCFDLGLVYRKQWPDVGIMREIFSCPTVE